MIEENTESQQKKKILSHEERLKLIEGIRIPDTLIVSAPAGSYGKFNKTNRTVKVVQW